MVIFETHAANEENEMEVLQGYKVCNQNFLKDIS